MLRVIAISLAIAALLLAGCGQAVQKAVEQSTGVKVDQAGEKVTITGKDGEKVTISSGPKGDVSVKTKEGEAKYSTSSSQVPDDLKDVPMPPGFNLESSATMSAGKEAGATASWKGRGTVQATAAFFKKEMPGRGWQEGFAMDSPAAAQLMYSKSGSQLALILTGEGDNVTINATMAKGSK